MTALGLMAILEIIKGVLQFPNAILRLVRVLQKTPQENHEALVKKNEDEASQYEKTGRPSW